MSTIDYIFGLILFYILYSVVSGYLHRRRQRRLVVELAPKLDSLIHRIDEIPIGTVSKEFRETKELFYNSLATLKGTDNSTINRCPKCHDTLSLKTTLSYGKIFGCPNYPRCRHLVKVVDLDCHVFDHLRVE